MPDPNNPADDPNAMLPDYSDYDYVVMHSGAGQSDRVWKRNSAGAWRLIRPGLRGLWNRIIGNFAVDA